MLSYAKFWWASLIALMFSLSTNVHAAIPAEVDTLITGLETDVASLFSKFYPLLIAIAGGFVVWRLVKRFIGSVA